MIQQVRDSESANPSDGLGGESYELCSKVIDRAILQTSLTVRNPTFQLSLADLGCIRIG
jgi:hypothetical protein